MKLSQLFWVVAHLIVTFDWTSMTYTKHTERFTEERRYSSCALLKDDKGAPLVAVAGGYRAPSSRGMEIWNPIDETVTTQIDVLPSDVGGGGLEDAYMVPINEGREVLLYGGLAQTYSDEIWKFSLAENSWTKVGTMLYPREQLIVLPVKGIQC